jgi:hypothetical protein
LFAPVNEGIEKIEWKWKMKRGNCDFMQIWLRREEGGESWGEGKRGKTGKKWEKKCRIKKERRAIDGVWGCHLPNAKRVHLQYHIFVRSFFFYSIRSFGRTGRIGEWTCLYQFVFTINSSIGIDSSKKRVLKKWEGKQSDCGIWLCAFLP